MAVLTVVMLVVAGCGRGEGERSRQTSDPTSLPSAPPVAVETGGMALPGASAAGEVTAGAATAGAPTPAPESSETPVEERLLPVGASVVAGGATAVYAEPDGQALRFAEYAAGSRFTVVEPDGDHTAYPVVAGGASWYRVRAEDGLVGWVNAQSLAGGS